MAKLTIPREQVWRMFDGHCAYCGHQITLKDMQVDHITPKRNGGSNLPHNLFPACPLCNHYKRATTPLLFKTWLLDGIIDRLQKLYIFRVALRYGLIEIKKHYVDKFYFESLAEL
ncbi:MAG: HNH endonuclease [Muribaculaceae bacterium]